MLRFCCRKVDRIQQGHYFLFSHTISMVLVDCVPKRGLVIIHPDLAEENHGGKSPCTKFRALGS